MKEWVVKNEDAKRLDKFLSEKEPSLSYGYLRRYLKENKIKVNGKKQPLSFQLCPGDTVRIFIPKKNAPTFLPVYEDQDLLVANKPAGLPVCGEDGTDTLISRVLSYLGYDSSFSFKPCLCHRLDTGTSGLVLIAKTSAAEIFLTQLIRQRAIQKKYLCVTYGHPSPANATLHAFLVKNAQAGTVRIYQTPKANSKEIITAYRTLSISGRLALLEVNLITGRTHQIRAHLASIGCPILGDAKYGDQIINRELRTKYQALCAYSLTFPEILSGPFAKWSCKKFELAPPWYAQQILDKTLT
ncbi:pseudouridine synthase [uncultured Ruthenibacterium sp.]|uniref:RluA family pseudouridine synthase n=1 Tax=uncultured Ruthenibacterium sp. TaxID=1905347 RepID=UPI00349E744F